MDEVKLLAGSSLSELDRNMQRVAMLVAEHLRKAGKEVDAFSVYFRMEVSGRPDGDMKITFAVSDSMYDAGQNASNAMSVSIEEWKRRVKWAKRNAPVLIGVRESINEESSNEDQPF